MSWIYAKFISSVIACVAVASGGFIHGHGQNGGPQSRALGQGRIPKALRAAGTNWPVLVSGRLPKRAPTWGAAQSVVLRWFNFRRGFVSCVTVDVPKPPLSLWR